MQGQVSALFDGPVRDANGITAHVGVQDVRERKITNHIHIAGDSGEDHSGDSLAVRGNRFSLSEPLQVSPCACRYAAQTGHNCDVLEATWDSATGAQLATRNS